MKRQAIFLPGNDSKTFRVKISTVSYSIVIYLILTTFVCQYQTSLDLLKELCNMLDVDVESDIQEFGIYADLGRRKYTSLLIM